MIVAIRFFRQLVVTQDDFYIKHLAEKQVLGPVLDVLLRTMPRDNLLSSACLELFVLIHKDNIKDLIKNLVENYREKVMALSYMETFREILNRYDQTQGYTATVESYFLDEEDEVARRPANSGARGMMEHLVMDPAQEEYWNTSDDEEEQAARATPENSVTTNGSTPKPLVEYTSDEEGEDSGDAVMTPAASLSPDDAFKENQEPPKTPTPANTSPPERLSEKRRREEDEDDAIEKLVHHKRRNSSASASNAANHPNVSSSLRKKKSFGGHRDSAAHGAGAKKIAISIATSMKNAAIKSAAGEEDGK